MKKEALIEASNKERLVEIKDRSLFSPLLITSINIQVPLKLLAFRASTLSSKIVWLLGTLLPLLLIIIFQTIHTKL